jgi:hypothetical protein
MPPARAKTPAEKRRLRQRSMPPPLLLLLLLLILLLLATSPAAAKRKPANEKFEPDPARVNIADGFGSATYPPLGKISRTGENARAYRCAVAPPAGGRGCRRLMLQLAAVEDGHRDAVGDGRLRDE